MSRVAERLSRSPFSGDPSYGAPRHIPILPSTTTSTIASYSQPETMEVTPPAAAIMAPPTRSSPEMESEGANNAGAQSDGTNVTNGAGGATLSAAAAASGQQPKVVQTAFIHKLYNMLEDQSIRNLISWSNTNDSFVVSPSSDFCRVLAQYFKHTNISSFVRQLNMYGFHKVSDVFHTGAPESTLWEFKHGNGNFKRGDLNGLREIKRRASRHALIHRDSFSTPHKPSVSQPGTPAEPMPDAGDPKLAHLENSIFDLYGRLARSEETNNALSTKCAVLTDNLVRFHKWNQEMCQVIMATIPNHDSPMYHDISSLQKDIRRHHDMMNGLEDSHELFRNQPHFSGMNLDPMQPISPRMMAQDERRSSLTNPRASLFRPPVPTHLSVSPRRYASFGGPNLPGAPPFNRSPNPMPPAPPTQHPLASVYEPPSTTLGSSLSVGPNLGRRHTSHDIRATPGWQHQGGAASPFESGPSSSHWPSSPNPTPSTSDQHVRDVLASYEIGGPRRSGAGGAGAGGGGPFDSRQHTPPTTNDTSPSGALGVPDHTWNFGPSKFPSRLLDSAPQTRRSSMASNVHSLLNPAETVERDEDDSMGDDRKRKRLG